MTQGIVASYGFPAADQGPAFNDNTLGPVDRLRSWTGFTYDPDPLPVAGIPGTMLRMENGNLFYGAWGNTLDDWPVILNFNIGDTGLANDGGVLTLTRPAWSPTQAGLAPGAMWSNGGVCSVVPGVVPDPNAAPVFFGEITEAGLLLLGGGNLPTSSPPVGSSQLWNSGGEVWVA
jgi:hypothetical protein